MRRARGAELLGPLLAIALAVALAAGVSGCQDDTDVAAAHRGDAENGRELFIGYGCGACHQHIDARGADGRVGPRLDDFAEQRIIAGVLPNTPEHLAAWIREPQRYAPNTAMPDLDVTEDDARDIAAFLSVP